MTASERVRYQRLPGRRRGVIRGSSVWLGPDHLLLVQSWRFREEYKRFHLGDIQAIAIASAPRFHISTRSLGIGVLWLIGYAASGRLGNWQEPIVWTVAAALVATWAYLCASCSCVCRIYTAVSCDELPSIYRTRTARKFMRRVESHIVAAQGALEGDWVEAIDDKTIGPPEVTPVEQPAPGVRDAGMAKRRSGRLSAIFVGTMFLDAALSYLEKTHATTAVMRIGYAVMAIEVGLSVALLIEHYRGRLRAGMVKLVIASLLVTGITWYTPQLIASFSAIQAASEVRAGRPAGNTSVFRTRADAVIADTDIGAHVLWGVMGIAILTRRQMPLQGGAGTGIV